MQLTDLQKQIVSGEIDKCLLIYGEEVAIMDIYLNKIYGALNIEVVRSDSVKEAFKKMMQRRITNAPRCFVVRDDRDFLKDDKAWGQVFSSVAKGSDYLILIYSSMDKRSKFYKHHTEQLTEFAKLSPDMLSSYIDRALPGVSHSLRLTLAEVCECSYSRILLEVDKVKSYSSFNGTKDHEGSLRKLLECGVIFQPVGDITFKFTDAILTRNYRDTAMYLQQAKEKGEPEIMVLSVLYNGFKQILMVQGLGADQSDACKRTGLTPWQVKLAKEKQGHYSISELVKALEIIRFVEKGIKTGAIDADIALDYAIINIM